MKNLKNIIRFVLSFVIAVSIVSAVCTAGIKLITDLSEQAYAAEQEESNKYIGQPAAAVVNDYGYPEGWAYYNTDTSDDVSQAVWYYDDIIFYILYADDVSSEGVVAGVEVVR